MFPTPAPESPSTTRQTQYGAALPAIHAPAPASAPPAHEPAVLAPDQRALALRPSSIPLISFPHRRFPADHAPPAASPSLPAAVPPTVPPPPPQTHSAIPHAVPRSHPDSASAPPCPVLPAAAGLPVCDSWRSLLPSAPETTAAAAQTTTAWAPTAKSAPSP